jgi:hypothetical protein
MAVGYKLVTETWNMLQNKNKTSATPSLIMALTIITKILFRYLQ